MSLTQVNDAPPLHTSLDLTDYNEDFLRFTFLSIKGSTVIKTYDVEFKALLQNFIISEQDIMK